MLARMQPTIAHISIHALREEGDVDNVSVFWGIVDFYPRPPRGGRLPQLCLFVNSFLFLSTPSARRATLITYLYFGVS